MLRSILVFVCILLSACAGSINPFLDTAASLMAEQPDSAYRVLSAIDKAEIRGERAKARYALLYTQAQDKNWIDVDNDSLIRIAVDYYKDHGENIDKAKAFYYSGVVYYNASDIDEAMKAFVNARIYAEKTDDQYLKGLIYSMIGDLYYSQYSFDEALQMYSSAIDAFASLGLDENRLLVLQSKGFAQVATGHSEAALKSLEEAEELAWKVDNPQAVMSILATLTSVAIKNDPATIHKLKARLFDFYRQYTGNVIPIDHYAVVGHLYRVDNKIDSAKYYYVKYFENNQNITFDNIGTLLVLSSLEYESKNYKKAYEYEKLYSLSSDSLNQVQRTNLIQSLERKYKTEYLQAQYETLQFKHKYEIASFILILFLIGIAITYIVIYYKRTIVRRNQQLAEYESYIGEVQAHYSELQDKYLSLTKNAHVQDERSQALFEVLGNRIQSLKQILEWASRYEKDPGKFYSQFKEHIKLASGKNRDLAEDVIAIANLTNDGIIDHLQTLYPSLSQHELCYCGFISLGFSHECIRIIYSHTNVYSIYTMRSKIRSKIGLVNNAISLEHHIESLMGKTEIEAAI